MPGTQHRRGFLRQAVSESLVLKRALICERVASSKDRSGIPAPNLIKDSTTVLNGREMENGYIVGVVTLYDRLRHWGFIAPTELDHPEVFVHGSNIVGTPGHQFLVRGMKVAFRIETNPRNGKLMAVRVIRLADPIVDPKIPQSPLAALDSPKTGVRS
jgi:cold shock CspA family protein